MPHRWIGMIVFGLLVSSAGSASAQFFIGGPGNRYVGTRSFISYRSGPFGIGLSTTSFAYYGAYGYYPYGAYYGNPYWGPPNPWFAPPAPIIIQQPAPIIIQQAAFPPMGGAGGAGLVPAVVDAGGGRPPVGAAAPKLGPAPMVPVDLPPPAPAIPPRAPHMVHADKAVDAGKKAFLDGQFGLAQEMFRRAVELSGRDAGAYFLLAQSQIALGKYREAVATITAGMTLKPDWADARWAPRALYGKKGESFDDHLTALRQALRAFEDDPALLFLLGHQLWFDKQREEARPLIIKARTLGGAAVPAEDFLK